jgi:capsid portal protein
MSQQDKDKFAFSVYGYVDPEIQNNYFEYDGKPWVAWGIANLFPQRIVEMYNGSAVNHSCILARVDGIVGKGLYSENEGAQNKLAFANPYESWDEVFAKAALDYVLFGGFSLNVIWNRAGDKIAEVYHVDFSTIRSGKKNELDEITEYWYSTRWELYNARKKQYRPIRFPAFNPKETLGEDASQIFYYWDYQPGNEYYPLPSYVGALNDIEIDRKLSLFHAANLTNGLTPSMFISMRNGIPDKDTRDKIYREMQESYAGAGNAGRFFLTFSDTAETAPEITPLNLTNDQYYLQLEQRISSRVLTGHRISSPLLLGIRDAGGNGLGSNSQEVLMSYNHFINTVVKPDQKTIVKQLDKMMRYVGYPNANLQVEQSPLLDEDIIIAQDVPTEERVDVNKLPQTSPDAPSVIQDEAINKLLNGVPNKSQI